MEDQENPLTGRFALLEDRAVFQLTGEDRVRYLNGQVTNDVSKDLETEAVAACVCSLKGKVEFLVWIRSDGDSLWIDGQLSQREELFARLDRYLIADDCEIHDRTEEGVILHHFDEEKHGTLSQRTRTKGRDLWLPLGEAIPFSAEHRMEKEDFEIHQLERGIPRAPEEITGAEFPAELQIDSWTVDFHTGCYLGQEVISRIESVGKVKRHLCLVVAKEPFEQHSILRNTSGQEFATTRKGKEISTDFYLGLAWTRGPEESEQPVPVE